jgi:hypothetical protein
LRVITETVPPPAERALRGFRRYIRGRKLSLRDLEALQILRRSLA